jgi:hypothetical protein
LSPPSIWNVMVIENRCISTIHPSIPFGKKHLSFSYLFLYDKWFNTWLLLMVLCCNVTVCLLRFPEHV